MTNLSLIYTQGYGQNRFDFKKVEIETFVVFYSIINIMDENCLPSEYTEEYCTSTHRVYRKWVLYDPESLYYQYALVEENVTPLEEEETSFKEEEA